MGSRLREAGIRPGIGTFQLRENVSTGESQRMTHGKGSSEENGVLGTEESFPKGRATNRDSASVSVENELLRFYFFQIQCRLLQLVRR